MPLDGPVAGSFQMPDNCCYPPFEEPQFYCLNPFPPPVMLQARHSPGATRSARPPGPGTPSGPTSATGPAFTAGPRSKGRPARGLGCRPLRLPGPLGGGRQTHGHHPASPGGHHHGDIYLALTAEQSVDKYIRQS